MPKCSNGAIYENFPKGRVFIEEGDRTVRIKAYRTYGGRIIGLIGWLCFSYRSDRPIVYSFTKDAGIKNVTYRSIRGEIESLVSGLANCWTLKSASKHKKLERKFVALASNRFYGKALNATNLSGEVIKTWLPLLLNYSNTEIEKAQECLQSSLIRRGLKGSCLEIATKLWFKQASPALIRRIEALLLEDQIELKHRLAQLTLLIACREWSLQDLYSLCDLSIHCYFSLNVQKAKQLFATYTPGHWLTIFEWYNLAQNYHDFFILDLAVNDFAEIDYQSHLLPQEPQSIEQISDALYNLLYPYQISCEEKSPFCCCDASPVLLMIDCFVCGKPYSS